MEVTTYSAVCRRAGNWWAISVPELKGVHTQTRRLDQVALMTQDAIALMLDLDPAAVEVTVQPVLTGAVSHAIEARNAARVADEAADHATATAVRSLISEGYTVRDAGALLGLSPQRISQIASRPTDSVGPAAA